MTIYLLVPAHRHSFRSKSAYADQCSPTTIRKFQVSILATCSINFEILGFEYKFDFRVQKLYQLCNSICVQFKNSKGKGKVMSPHHDGRGVEFQLLSFVALMLDGGKWSASLPSHFIHMKERLVTHWVGGWVGLRAVLMFWRSEQTLANVRI